MTLIKTSILSLIATFFKMLSGLVINKAVSVYIGPSGLALIGQFQNFTQIALIAAQGAINNGVVKYSSEYTNNKKLLRDLFSTALRISLIMSVIVSVSLILLSKHLSYFILSDTSYQSIFILFGITLTLFVLNGLFLSILNGLQEIATYIKINIIQSIFSLVFTSALIYYYGLYGALSALATNQSIVFIIALLIIKKNKKIDFKLFKNIYKKHISKKLLSFSFMAIVSASLLPITQFIIRNHIVNTHGAIQAGYWQGISYISSMYLMVITTALSTYYLPKLSAINGKNEIISEIKNGYKILLPIAITGSIVIFLMRNIIIDILFSKEFMAMEKIFIWQVIGDVFKIASWLISYVLLAKAMTYIFISTEIIFSLSLSLLSVIFINKYGAEGATIAYLINYIVYFISMLFILYKLKLSQNKISSHNI